MFVFMLIFSMLVTISSSSWLVCWMMMEVSSFFFVPILFGFWSVSSVMISLKYFLIQSIGSSLFIFSIFWESAFLSGWEWVGDEKEMSLITCLSMMIKLGVFPFSGWMIHVCEGMSWKNFFLLSTIQEVIPLIMISKFGKSEEILLFFVCLSVFVFVSFCFMNYSIHWMMMISSMFNVNWMIVASLVSKESLIFFFLVYFSIVYVFFSVLDSTISMEGLTAMSSFSLIKGGKVMFLFIVFMMMGIPPFGNFLGKVEVLSSMIESEMVWLSIYLIFMSSLFMYLYLKISLCLSVSIKSMSYKIGVDKLSFVLIVFLFVLFLVWMY